MLPLAGVDPALALQLAEPAAASTAAPRAAEGREAARQFEAFLAQMMIREMRRTVPEGIFSGGALEVFSDLFDQELATRIAEGRGLGLADALSDHLGGAADADPRPRPRPAASRRGVLPVLGRLSSRFGHRADPFDGDHRMHRGVDIAAPAGTPIRAAEGGTVTLAAERSGYGRVVVVDHGDGSSALYAHCQDLHVSPGQAVRAGQPIATVGSTGRSTGPHLHFELRSGGEVVDPVGAYGWRP